MYDLADAVTADPGAPRSRILSPFDQEPVGEVPLTGSAALDRAFTTASAAQKAWETTSLRDRARILERFAGLLIDHRDDLLDLIGLETGKNRASAMEEFADTVLWTHHVARRGPALLRERRRPGAFPVLTRTVERHLPKGVVGVITPWNYPLTLPIGDAVPALMAGNAVILKPDSQTPLTAAAALSLLREAGLPTELMQIAVGPGRRIGAPIVERSDFLMFTGSTATGRELAARCAERLIGFSAELGGKNPLLVLADADLSRAVPGAVHACFANSGQLCISMERIYVHESVWEPFVTRFVARTRALRLAAGTGWDADMGSLAGAGQLRKAVEAVDDARAKGATVLAGGRPRPDLGPYFYEPTVLSNVVPGMRVHDEETFGPVVSLYRAASDEEAVDAADDSEYGLNASVWSRRRGGWAARRLHSGTVNINEGYGAAWASHDAPMGGFKASGLGRRHGDEGILKYTEAQTVAAQRLIPIAGPAALGHRAWAGLLTGGVRALRRFR
nr:succinic semialdehyde dehydrogenase [Acidipropionibacterium virtanenii]